MGLGPLGLLLAHLASHSGAGPVTGIDRIDRRDIAGAFGVDETMWSGSRAWADGPGATRPADVVVEAIGHQAATLNDAIAVAAPDGHVVGFGVPDIVITAVVASLALVLLTGLVYWANSHPDTRRPKAQQPGTAPRPVAAADPRRVEPGPRRPGTPDTSRSPAEHAEHDGGHQ